MAGASARPVTMSQLLKAKLVLEGTIHNLAESLKIMTNGDIPTIELRTHVAMTRGVKSVDGMASEARRKARNAHISKELGEPTDVEINRDHHAKYPPKPTTGKKPKKKPGA